MNLAERKLQEYKEDLAKTGVAYLGDPSDFHKMLADRENDHEASFISEYSYLFDFLCEYLLWLYFVKCNC